MPLLHSKLPENVNRSLTNRTPNHAAHLFVGYPPIQWQKALHSSSLCAINWQPNNSIVRAETDAYTHAVQAAFPPTSPTRGRRASSRCVAEALSTPWAYDTSRPLDSSVTDFDGNCRDWLDAPPVSQLCPHLQWTNGRLTGTRWIELSDHHFHSGKMFLEPTCGLGHGWYWFVVIVESEYDLGRVETIHSGEFCRTAQGILRREGRQTYLNGREENIKYGCLSWNGMKVVLK